MDTDPGSEGPDPRNVMDKTRRIRDPDPRNVVDKTRRIRDPRAINMVDGSGIRDPRADPGVAVSIIHSTL